ncbi:MAG: DUF1552 domain-containing protein [Sandaracinaceae bacterium]
MKRFTRRQLLGGAAAAGGAAFLAPLLRRFAQADEAGSCRFVFVVEGNGFEPVTVLADSVRARLDATMRSPIGSERWWPNQYAHTSTIAEDTSDFGSAIALGAIEAQGLASQTTVLLGMSSKVIGGGHSAFHGTLSSTRTVGGAPGGMTIDHYLGALPNVRGETPFDVLRLGVGTGRALDFGTCAFGAARPAPMMLYPTTAYEVLFGAVATAEAQQAFQRRGDLLSFAHDDVMAAQAELAGSSVERAKLDQYLMSIETLQARHARLLALEDQLRANAPEAPATNPLYTGEPLDTLAAQLELATAALMGELTNVVVVGSGTGGDFGLTYSSVSSVGRHDMQHTSGSDPAMLQAVHTVTTRQVDLVAQMARRLADTPDVAGGNMLDHTLICYVGDNGEQHHSQALEFPVVLIGGSALGLRSGGKTIVVPGRSEPGHRQLSNLWNSVGYLAGQTLDTFGGEGPSRVAPGPLSELVG